MVANRQHPVAKTERRDMPEGKALARRNETAEVMRCLNESLREPSFASALVQLLVMNVADVERNEEFRGWQ